jgi:hypothetical protein
MEGWGWFSSFVVPVPGMGVSLIPGNAKNLSIAACEPFFTGYAKLAMSVPLLYRDY